MPQPRITQLGAFTATGQGTPRVALAGDHVFAATVSGAGSVSATVLIEVSNDLLGWATLTTLSLTGTGSASATAARTASHGYWRATVSAMTGTSVTVTAATEEAVASSGGSGSAVPGDGIPAATWADLLAMAPDDGTTATLGAAPIPGGIGYTQWVRTGGAWRLRGEQQLAVDFSLATGAANTTEQILKTYDLPAGFLMSLRYLRVAWICAKSGTTDAATAIRLRIGTTGTASDAQIAFDPNFAAGNRQRGMEMIGFAASSSFFRLYNNGAGGFLSQQSSSSAYPQQLSFADLAAAQKITLSIQMAGATDVPSIPHVIISAA